MKLLMSTYSCSPRHGSEHAVGWNWTTEAHRLGHEVWALASPVHRAAIESACRDNPELEGIRWVFPEVAGWPLAAGIEPKWERTYNLLWQLAALRHANELTRQVNFDVVHHLTWGGVRAPTFLGALGIPLIIGPIGGGETTPRRLRDGFHFKAKLTEWLRDFSNQTVGINPVIRGGLDKATAIFVRTPETRRLIPKALRAKTEIFMELSLRRPQIGVQRAASARPPRLLFVGRLLYWKGVHIAIEAFQQLRVHMPAAKLTIVGSGPEEGRIKAQAAAANVVQDVEFIPWLPREQIFDLYETHDLLVFPSLHDSGGTVVLEAMSRGLPVICLDLGGPPNIVSPGGGVVVTTKHLNTAGVAQAMAWEIQQLFANPERLSELSAGAIARAGEFVLTDRVKNFYSHVARLRGQPAAKTRRMKRIAGPPDLASQPLVETETRFAAERRIGQPELATEGLAPFG